MSQSLILRSVSNILCTLVLTMLLIGCGGSAIPPIGNGEDIIPTPTSKATPKPKASPTPKGLYKQVHTGNGYSVGYPDDWTRHNKDGITTVFYGRPILLAELVIVAGTSGSSAYESLTRLLSSNLGGAYDGNKFDLGSMRVDGVSATAIISGVLWEKRGFTAEKQGVPYKGEALATQHNGKVYQIYYNTTAHHFDETFTEYFQKILQTFKFTS